MKDHKFVAIILSFLRPFNIEPICKTLLSISEISQVIVSNNHPSIVLEDLMSISDERLTIISQENKTGPIKRFEIALKTESNYFISIDDDLFLTRDQILIMMQKFVENPVAPHGFWGQNVYYANLTLTFSGSINESSRVDILNRCYLFTKEHTIQLFNLMKDIEISPDEVGPCDDILLSFSGNGKPYSHNIGVYEDCPTGNMKGIAQWMEDDFNNRRAILFLKLLKQKRHSFKTE